MWPESDGHVHYRQDMLEKKNLVSLYFVENIDTYELLTE